MTKIYIFTLEMIKLMWKYSLFFLPLLYSCSPKSTTEEPTTSVLDSIVFNNYVGDYTVLRYGVEYYVTTRKSLTEDTLFLDTGDYHIKVEVDKNYNNDTVKYSYHLLSEYKGIGTLAKQAKYYKPVTSFKQGSLRTVKDIFIDSLAVTPVTKISYYLNGKPVSDPYSKSFEEEVPFVPLRVPN